MNIQLVVIPLLTNTFMPPRYDVSAEAMEDAIRRKTMFNLLDTTDGDKVDL